jgi:8-amino-7-oxononanoate synthase
MVPSARDRLLTDLSEQLGDLDARGLLRRLSVVEAVDGPRVRIGGREAISWCSNDYLGLSAHPRLVRAATQAAADWGIGARASRLLAGTTAWHARLEEALASWFGAEAAIVYPSGYLANTGTLGALLLPSDAVFMDRLCHASLFDAVRATRARLRIVRHNDLAHLAQCLSRSASGRRRLIITEGVFSMEGDRAPLGELVDLGERHGAMVYVDDAHGAFVLGPRGRGTPEAAGVPHDRILYMGTLGKALGCQGGFVIGPKTLIRFLQNRARPFLYTTALAVPVAAAAVEALRLVRDEPGRRADLEALSARLSMSLASRLGTPPAPPSHIVPVIVGQARRALELADALWERGMWAPAIRPPTVPDGTARLRLSLTAAHTASQVDALVEGLHATLPGVRALSPVSFP